MQIFRRNSEENNAKGLDYDQPKQITFKHSEPDNNNLQDLAIMTST